LDEVKRIVILSYGLGNIRSVSNAFRSIGVNAEISLDKNFIMSAHGLVIPGVGSFPHGMASLIKLGLIDVIQNYVASGRPVLGICLGMQMLFNRGSEFLKTDGLGLISGSVDQIKITQNNGRLPHIAWSKISPTNLGRKKMFAGMSDEEMRFYFVHSYAANGVSEENVSAIVPYLGINIVAAVESGNIWGTQFHPEKSGLNGLHILKNFLSIC